MDTELLTSFLETAHRLHFGNAADRLGLTQSALSHQIQRLERAVGAALFIRTSREVRLTAAGESFISHARRVLGDLEHAVAQCRAVAAGGAGQFRVGSIGAALNSVTPRLVRDLLEQVPGLAIEVTQMDTPPQLAALRAAELDIGVVRSAGPATGIQLEDLYVEPMNVALSTEHPLAVADVLSAIDLRDESFILWPQSASPLFYRQVLAYCERANFVPRIIMEGRDIETQLGMVSAGIGVSPQPASFANLGRRGVIFKSLVDAPLSTVQLAWLTTSPPLRLSIAIAAAHRAVDEP
jgi:DNA-binding transcriptional LysR family regulator